MCQNNFNLSSESFGQGDLEREVVFRNIRRLYAVNEKIKSFNDNVFRDDEIFSIQIIDEKQLVEIMYSPHIEFPHDYKTILIEIVGRAKNSNGEAYQEVGLNELIENNIIYTVDELMQYYYEKIEQVYDEEEFSVCIKKYFQKLEFQEKISESLKTLDAKGLKSFARDIIKSLKYLENEFKIVLNDNHGDVRKSLIKLSSSIGLETTIEGDADRKPDFTFEFIKDDGTPEQVCCEPHVKLSESSEAGDSTYYFNRLHFHVGREDIKNGNILIGSIGKHL